MSTPRWANGFIHDVEPAHAVGLNYRTCTQRVAAYYTLGALPSYPNDITLHFVMLTKNTRRASLHR